MSIIPFKEQDYETLKQSHDSSNLFVDNLFPASEKSMYYSQRAPRNVVWKRPKEVFRNPKFVVDGFSRLDMNQGEIGDCWFIAGCVGIMQSPTLFAKVVPPDQSFESDDYAGIFHFRFWQYGQWVDVVIDDKLPFYTDGRLVFARNSETKNEFWAPLLEKAYAKLFGSYENLEGGHTTDALIDMSGGLQEQFDIKKLDAEQRSDLWRSLFQGYHKKSIMGCSINPDPRVKEARMSNGLVQGHAYTITKLATLQVNGRNIRLLRIRNPWGNEVEWKGAWSDNSREWNAVSQEQKEEVGLNFDRDGEFWMNYDDFLNNWEVVQICHLSVDSFSDEIADANNLNNMSWRKLASDSDSAWNCTVHHSKWIPGKTAGGCGNGNSAKYWTNPQFMVTLNDVDMSDNENKATLVVALMQKDSRLKRMQTGEEQSEEYIGFRLFKIMDHVEIDETKSSGLRLYANQLEKIGASGPYTNSREVTKRFRLEPGHYLVIPSTYEPDHSAEFIVRLFTEQEAEASSLEEHKENLNDDESFFEVQDCDQIFSDWGNFLQEEE